LAHVYTLGENLFYLQYSMKFPTRFNYSLCWWGILEQNESYYSCLYCSVILPYWNLKFFY